MAEALVRQLRGRRREVRPSQPGSYPFADRCQPWQGPVEQLVHPLLALFFFWIPQPYHFFLLFSSVAPEVN